VWTGGPLPAVVFHKAGDALLLALDDIRMMMQKMMDERAFVAA
jgi:hypothetical protein